MKAHGSIEIAAPPERIWPFLVEPEQVIRWSDTCKKYQYAGEQHTGVGTKYYLEEQAGGPLMKITFEAKEWTVNKKLLLKMISGSGVKDYQQTYSLEKTTLGSRLDFVELVEMPMGILGKLIGLMAEPMSVKTIARIQLKLKELVEAG
jgi:carbon monoxide dehydrogenase subunit G